MKDISDASGDEESPKRLRFEDLTMIDGFSGLGTVAIAARASGMKVNSVLKEVYSSKRQERTQNGQCLFEALEVFAHSRNAENLYLLSEEPSCTAFDEQGYFLFSSQNLNDVFPS